jgi:hypothetical protein
VEREFLLTPDSQSNTDNLTQSDSSQTPPESSQPSNQQHESKAASTGSSSKRSGSRSAALRQNKALSTKANSELSGADRKKDLTAKQDTQPPEIEANKKQPEAIDQPLEPSLEQQARDDEASKSLTAELLNRYNDHIRQQIINCATADYRKTYRYEIINLKNPKPQDPTLWWEMISIAASYYPQPTTNSASSEAPMHSLKASSGASPNSADQPKQNPALVQNTEQILDAKSKLNPQQLEKIDTQEQHSPNSQPPEATPSQDSGKLPQGDSQEDKQQPKDSKSQQSKSKKTMDAVPKFRSTGQPIAGTGRTYDQLTPAEKQEFDALYKINNRRTRNSMGAITRRPTTDRYLYPTLTLGPNGEIELSAKKRVSIDT